jgi:hypothetical protein
VVAQAGCFNGTYATATNFGRTPQAKFHVRAGELTNLGILKLEFKGGNLLVPPTSLHRAVQPMNPQVAAHLKSRIPQAFPRLVNRPMTLIGPGQVSASSL